jgi:two-component system cell cycle sensor histidine kinase PleC
MAPQALGISAVGFAIAQKAPVPADAPEADVLAELLPALDCLRTAITLYDARERLIYANQHFDYLFRALPQRAALIGCRYDEIVRMEIAGGEIAEDALLGDAAGFVARRRAQLTAGDFRPFDLPLSDGRIIEIKSRPVKSGGWVALWSDVTAARHAIWRLENATEMAADAFAFFDRSDALAICNQEFAHLYGRGVEEMRGETFEALITGAVRQGRIKTGGDPGQWIARRLDLHNAPAGAMTIETKTGAAYLVRDRRTRDGGRVSVLTDVTNERRAEAALAEQTHALKSTREALARSKDEAERHAGYLADLTRRMDAAAAEVDTTKKTLLRTMSHELKTPLNAIIGFSDLLQQMAENFGPAQVKEYAGLIHIGGHNLLRLINQILDLTKIAGGRFELRPGRIDAGTALWATLGTFAAQAAAKNITLDADGCPIGLLVNADECALGQIVSNLVGNAVAYTPDGGRVTLSARRMAGRIAITVADNGPGVAEADMARILQPFEQAGRNTTNHANGAGLGLTLAKALAELQGGALAIASVEGQGFAATVELPAAN